jgi:hypothetical protein
MSHQQSLDALAIIELERRELKRVQQLSFEERGKLLAAACRDAAAIEASRLKMGLPASKPEPWPESTWRFLAEAMRRIHNQSKPG